jgi:DNA helicase HerA-like ATPase
MSFGFSVFGSATAGIPGSGVTAGASSSVSTNIGITGNYGYTFGKSDADSINDTLTVGTNKSVSIGDSENTTFSHKSYMISGLVEKLEATIKRINESQATGLWHTAIYVMSQNSEVSTNAANFLNSIMQGDASYLEPPFIQTWYKYDKSNDFKNILQYVKHIAHPIFENKIDRDARVLPTANVSTSELSNLFAFPRYSVQGFPVIECARFGREPHSLIELKSDINIGCAYHMHAKEENNRVFLCKNGLTKHTFITGSTGSGKSNTIYKLIDSLCPEKSDEVKFLVIEPAKGEYKNVFGGREDVTTYGTNPFKSPHLLQINPFSFPGETHVLEHIDRLVEVFNACWPMYAAMPAILKESVEKSYEECGWNLKTSQNAGVYPTFDTLLNALRQVVESTEYSADTLSDYKGALMTRVKSLTRGIHGQIFKDDFPSEELFNSNVIVDLSRIGSQETKALIMGILVLKLQEFRMSEDIKHNSGLRHITVLEEAHNLLRRTSSEQSQESSNLQGKSVEMLANAIAEMRTYGEGFIIADQSPGLMDMSVIRNTNTKIIMRLPDESDRRLVGKAAGLNDSQIDELSRLEIGVAAISQSDWLEPVLCKVDEFKDKHSLIERFKTYTFKWADDENLAIQQFLRVALDVEHFKLTKDVVDKVRNWYDTLGVNQQARYLFENVLEGNKIDDKQKILLVRYVVGEKIKKIVVREDVIAEVKKVLIGKYGVEENSEVIRRINELFLLYFPSNEILDDTVEQTERLAREGSLL